MVDEADKIQAIFLAALEQPESERAAFLDQHCGTATPRRQRVEELLAAHVGSDSLLDLTSPLLPRVDLPWLLQPGSMIGPYKLLEEIGHGGMGVVYLAEQSTPVQRRVALKVIKPGMDSRSVVSRFEAERQVLSLMDHPHIAKVFDGGTTDNGLPYFVMELVQGRPITQYCDEHRLSLRERIALFIPVCQAIQHAHQKGIIHRDIKPTNVLVAEGDERPLPKVIDFGVAKALDQPLSENTLFTGMGQIVGTLEYLSPEQAEGNRADIDTRSDVYSLGVLLYELLAGTTPFEPRRLRAAAFDEMLRIVREEEPPRPSTRLSSHDNLPLAASNRQAEPARLSGLLRGELDWVVMKSLDKDRNRRYESPTALAWDLQRYLADEPVQACPPSRRYRVGKFLRRYKGPVIAASLIAATLLVATIVSSLLAVRANTAQIAADRDLKRAVEAEKQAVKESARAREETERAVNEEQTVTAMLDFLRNDLLSQASPYTQADPDVRLRTVVDRAAQAIESRFKDRPLVEASIRSMLGEVYDSLGAYDESLKHTERAYQLSLRELGAASQQTLQLASRRARAHVSEGTLKAILADQRTLLGPRHPDTLQTSKHLANVLDILDRPQEAIAIIEPLTRLYDEGEAHPDAADALRTYGNLLRKVDRADEALTVYRKGLRIAEEVLGERNPTTLQLRQNIAMSFSRSGESEKAIRLLIPLLETRIQVLHIDHPAVFYTILEFRTALQQCRASNAAFTMEAAVEMIRSLAEDDPEAAGITVALGVAYFDSAKWDVAIETLERSLRHTKGEGFVQRILLSVAYAKSGSGDLAREAYDKAVASLKGNTVPTVGIQLQQAAAEALGLQLEVYEATEERREAWRQAIRQRAEACKVVSASGKIAGFISRDLYRYSDPETGMQESFVMGWGLQGRPWAIGCPHYGGLSDAEINSDIELVSLSDEPFSAHSSKGWRWSPQKTDILLQVLPLAGIPADDQESRTLQMVDLNTRLTATSNGVKLELKPGPVHRYSDEQAGLLDGAIFIFAVPVRENPEILVLLEARKQQDGAHAWQCGFARLSAGPLSVSIDSTEIWSVPARLPAAPDEAYVFRNEPWEPEAGK